MIDNQLGGQQRIHPLGIAAHLHDRIAHRGEIDDRRHAREVLEQHTRRHERDFLIRHLARVPAGQLLDVLGPDHAAVFAPQQVLEQDLERIGQPGDAQTTPLQ